MMYKWILRDVKSNLPPASHTNLGVGGMVFNDQNQILVVTEKNFEYPHWKLPGGYVERGKGSKWLTSLYCNIIYEVAICSPKKEQKEVCGGY